MEDNVEDNVEDLRIIREENIKKINSIISSLLDIDENYIFLPELEKLDSIITLANRIKYFAIEKLEF